MRDSQMSKQMTNGLTMRWAPVVDQVGRTHLEARWTAPAEPVAPTGTSHAA